MERETRGKERKLQMTTDERTGIKKRKERNLLGKPASPGRFSVGQLLERARTGSKELWVLAPDC